MEVSELADLHGASVADIFPTLSRCSTMRIDERLFDRRSLTTLRRCKCETWGDLRALSVGDLWSAPNAGRLTVERILTTARIQAARYPDTGNWWAPPVPGTAIPHALGPIAGQQSREQAAVGAFVALLADWAMDSRGATTVADLLAALGGPLPADLSEAIAELGQFAVVDILPTARTPRETSTMIVDFLDSIGSDARFVVERHIAKPSGRIPTLESLGESGGVTRERIRQIVSRGIERAQQMRGVAEYRLLSWRAAELRRTLGSACRVASPAVDAAIQRAARGFADPAECSACEFMLWLAGEYREHDGWWISGETGRLEIVLRSVRSVLQGQWLLERQGLVDSISEAGIVINVDDADIAELTGWRSIGADWWVRWDGSLGDKAERVLRLALRAIQPGELNEMIGEGHAKSSVQNVLSSDGRFTRVSMDLEFALTDWGWEEYSTAAQEIVERIERAGGEAVLDDVVIELFNQFGLKEGTVRAYAASPAFVVAGGRIRVRREDEPVQVNDRIASAPGLYVRADGCVVFHFQVDADVLRGSGRSIPNPLSVALGVRPGDARDFSAGGVGRVRVSWPATAVTGAAIGSTRGIAERVGAQLGDVLRLLFDPDAGTVEGSVVSGGSLTALTGLTLTPGGEAAELAAALRVAPSEIRAALAERGDEVVAALIPLSRPSRGLDDALSRLDGLLG